MEAETQELELPQGEKELHTRITEGEVPSSGCELCITFEILIMNTFLLNICLNSILFYSTCFLYYPYTNTFEAGTILLTVYICFRSSGHPVPRC